MWRSAQGRAVRQERAVAALEAAAPTTTIRNALAYIIAARGTVSIPIRIEATGPTGQVWRQLVFVSVNPGDTIQQMWQQAAQFAVEAEVTYGITVNNYFVHQGIQLL